MVAPPDIMFCPRCDRPYEGEGTKETSALEKVKRHVREQHHDHDPQWYETYPENLGT
jgi:hypothetical protein